MDKIIFKYKNSMNEESNLKIKSLLENSDKYKDTLEDKLDIIFKKYLDLINEFIILFMENPQISNLNNLYFLLLNGIKTITHVFSNILLYTNNLNLADFYLQKAYYLYTEFISQIDNLNNTYLKLNGKDATLFVYKKTIYEIDNKCKENFIDNQKNKFKIIKFFFDFMSELYILTFSDQILLSNKIKFIESKNKINYICKILIEIFSIDVYFKDDYKITLELIKFLEKFLNLLSNNLEELERNSDKIIECLIILLLKIKKNKLIDFKVNNLNLKLINLNQNNDPKKIINKIIN